MIDGTHTSVVLSQAIPSVRQPGEADLYGIVSAYSDNVAVFEGVTILRFGISRALPNPDVEPHGFLGVQPAHSELHATMVRGLWLTCAHCQRTERHARRAPLRRGVQ